MSLTKKLFEPFKSELGKKALSTSLPLSILLIPLEALIDKDFSCPCKVELNATVSNLIFAAPFFFVLALTCLALRPVKHADRCSFKNIFKLWFKRWFCTFPNVKELSSNCPNSKECSCKCPNFKESSSNCPNVKEWYSNCPNFKQCFQKCVKWRDFFLCLIPPFVWIILVLLDGDYVACQDTYWNGVYISDDQLHVKWCKPTKSVPRRNETELQALTLSFIATSQNWGYGLLLVFSIGIIVIVACDVCRSEEKPQNEDMLSLYM
ncbi:uncharacterized protein LOC107653572 [Sinocyclocheilus anshuiensis]|uniref:uncharacterized protein LOC107653572 n=1 Tax=Sinocyclocheilus anshuiensis TaxID=1608454 RepID=UPI0007B7ECFD|nr:PREDICTED: uncharacterized protein LOC107653572 [Sinocyclocheilus anshuiensis]XP_016295796.1 PREDICTED: uncharacterized protein LOC107653572 [Sinocyclocheilus anshuiensis]